MMDELSTPWDRAKKLRYQKQEERLSKLPGGQKGVNSGRIWNFKRDGRLYDFLIEAKDTQSAQYILKLTDWQALAKDAVRVPPGLRPAMQVTIQNTDLVVISLRDFQDLKQQAIELEAMVEKPGDLG
jgi:hypothetical protein